VPAPSSSVVRALEVCRALADQQPVGVRELARALDSPRSSVQRALESLEAAGWAVREGGTWSLTLVPGLIGMKAGSPSALRVLAGPPMQRLVEESDETVRLWVRDGRNAVLVHSVDGQQAVRYVSPPAGQELPLHASAAGKAMLAAVDAAGLQAYLARPLNALTSRTLTGAEALRRELAAVRRRGYATTDREAHADVSGVAAAVLDDAGLPVAALSLALPAHRGDDRRLKEYGRLVVTESKVLGERLRGELAAG
jgi:DNA-binding IclR family transcriptional regulator